MPLVSFDSISSNLGVITLKDPNNLNAMGEEMADEFSALVKKLKNEQTDLRALILTGEGRAFSAGGNLEMLEKKIKLSSEENRKRMLWFYDSFLCLLSLRVPIIAAINGHAIGAGLCLASACDIRIAVEGAKLGFTFVKLGLHPGMGATYFLPRVVGYSQASELMLSGRVIDAKEAMCIGLVSKVVAVEKILDEAIKIAQEIIDCGPEAVHQLLESLRNPPASLTHALQREALCQSINYKSAEFKEGVRAALEKRKPSF